MVYFEVGEDVLKSRLKVCGRTPERFNQDVTTLKEWMKTQRHLPEILDDKYIGNFLLLNKCSIERAKQKIDMYYTVRSAIPDFFENINPKLSVMQETLDILYYVPLPKLTGENYRVVVYKMRNRDLIDRKDPVLVAGNAFNTLELRLKEDCMCGDVIIIDMEGISFGYFFTKYTPSLLKKTFTIYEKAYSAPMKGFYVLNAKPWIQQALKILKTFLKPKLFARVRVCEDASIMREDFPKEILPRDYGGEERSLEELQEILKEQYRKYEGRFDQMDKLRVNEGLRPEKLNNDEILGFHGNFTKLDVD